MPGGTNHFLRAMGVGLLLLAAGCAGTRGTHQFEPIPSGDIYSSDLKPAHTPVGEYKPVEIPDPLPERVVYEINDIRTRYPKNFQTGLDRAQLYLPYVEDIFRREGLPPELVWVAMVESQFHPRAVSRAGASGMWQFMEPAARRFGLRKDTYVDERFDWKRQTSAAAAYLKALYDHFDGDWALAVSAYNMGEGGLGRLIAAHGGERDFWKLVEISGQSGAMREETQKYYPRLLATSIVATNPEQYGFKINPAAPDDTVDILVEGMYALDDLDEALGYPHGTLASLNPVLTQGVTPPSGGYQVYVPRADREQFLLALNSQPKVSPEVGTHKVKRGETISEIARQYNVSHRELMALNGIKSAQRLRVGETLRIPGQVGRSPASVSETRIAAAPPTQPARQTIYTVRKGDTLSSIAKQHGVSVDEIQEWNGMGSNTKLAIGDTLKLSAPASVTTVASLPSPNATYTVAAGDTLSSIATRHGVQVRDIQQWNGLGDSTSIKAGQTLRVHDAGIELAGAAGAPPAPAANAEYTVQSGDTLSAIAKRHGVTVNALQAWNNLGSSATIRPGQRLAVAAATVETPAPAETAAVAGGGKVHTVKAGEYPAAIARANGITVEKLSALNNLNKNSVIHIGDRLVVSDDAAVSAAATPQLELADPAPADAAVTAAPAAKKVTYKVTQGDTPGGIARKHGVSTRDLLAWNNLSPNSVIKVGQELALYPGAGAPAAASEAESEPNAAAAHTHVVEKGQTPWTIARHYGVPLDDLLKWNNWRKDQVLHVGEKVTVYTRK